MKALRLLTISAVFVSAAFISGCKKDGTTDDTTPPTTPGLTVEQNKTNMQAAGQNLLTQLNDAKSMEALDATSNFADLMKNFKPSRSQGSVNSLKVMQVISALNVFHQKGDVNAVYASMRGNGPSSPQDAFNQLKATYTWNSTTSKWDSTGNSTNLVFHFPASKTAITNTAELTVDYTGYTTVHPFVNYTGDLPQSFTANLKVSSVKKLGIALNVAYGTDGIPTLTTFGIDLDPYHFLYELTTTSVKVGFNFSFKKNVATLVDYGVNVNGNFTKSNLEAMNDSVLEANLPRLATSGDAHFQIMNIKIQGDLNIQGVFNGMKALPSTASEDQKVAVINANYHLGVYYADNNTRIANTEFYVRTKTNTYTYWEYNPNTNQSEMKTKTETRQEPDMRFVFDDGSRADMETYFNTGFSQLQSEVETFMTDMNNAYGKN